MSCEYCKNKLKNECLIKSDDKTDGVEVKIYRKHDGAFIFAWGWFDGLIGIEPERVKINYCPMCGEGLWK